jgi:hypothetical protein
MRTKPPAPDAKPIAFREIRDQIKDGDLFLFRGNFRSSKIFEWLTNSYYSHAALVAWWGGRLMILQAEGPGLQAIPLSVAIAVYPGRVDWFRLRREDFPDVEARLQAVLLEAKSDLGLPFGVRDLFKRALRWLRVVKLRDPVSPKGMFCSEYVERCFRIGGMPLRDAKDIATWPQQIAESPHVQYVATIIHDNARLEPRDIDDVHTGLTRDDHPTPAGVRPPA